MSFAGEMQKAARDKSERVDPWLAKLERGMAGIEMISTAAILQDVLQVDHTKPNARRLAPLMRSLGYIATINRRMYPGGFRDTVSRGWTRPTRPEK